MKKSVLKTLSIVLCAALVFTCVGAGVYALSPERNESITDTEPAEEPESVSAEAVPETDEQSVSKTETVYVIADANGSAQEVIVSDWLKNPNSQATIRDNSDLSDIEGVKGDESYTVDTNGMQVWNANGEDVYYQGKTDRQLPVDLTVTYQLDGKPISAEDLAGKSGRVTIRFDYTNNQYEYVDINGQQEKMYVPFAMLTGVALDDEQFRNVEVSNGKIFNDGSRTVAIGMAFPGLQENLALDADVLELPDYVEISADVENFSLDMTMTIAVNSPFSDLELDDVKGLDDLNNAMAQITDAMDDLMDGARQLYDGLEELTTASGSISDGIAQLSGGLNALTANNDALNGGARQVFESMLATANSQLSAAGLNVPTLTVENYSDVLGGLISSADSDAITAAARAQVEANVRAQEETIRAAVTAQVQQQVSAQVEAAVRANVRSQVLASMGLTEETIPEEMLSQIDAAVEQQMSAAEVRAIVDAKLQEQMASDDVQAMISSKTEEQIQLLTDQHMGDAQVQQQISSAIAQAGAGAAQLQNLKAQLDSYNTFYQGLLSYTDGVAQAAAGANQLNAAMPEFVSGVTQLRDGALQLSDGLAQFNEQGVKKLTDALDGDVSRLIDRLRATVDLSRSYQSFSGMADGMEGETQFVYKTASIDTP